MQVGEAEPVLVDTVALSNITLRTRISAFEDGQDFLFFRIIFFITIQADKHFMGRCVMPESAVLLGSSLEGVYSVG